MKIFIIVLIVLVVFSPIIVIGYFDLTSPQHFIKREIKRRIRLKPIREFRITPWETNKSDFPVDVTCKDHFRSPYRIAQYRELMKDPDWLPKDWDYWAYYGDLD